MSANQKWTDKSNIIGIAGILISFTVSIWAADKCNKDKDLGQSKFPRVDSVKPNTPIDTQKVISKPSVKVGTIKETVFVSVDSADLNQKVNIRCANCLSHSVSRINKNTFRLKFSVKKTISTLISLST